MSAPVLATLHFPNRVQAPPGGWRYKVPESGRMFYGTNEPELLMRLDDYYRANQWQIPANIQDLIEQQICEQAGDYCVEQHGMPQVTQSKAAKVAFHLARDMTQRFIGIDRRVTQEQADARAGVCVGCTENVPREECSQCNSNVLRDLIVKITQRRETQYGEQLKVCRVCFCENRAKVWLQLDEVLKLTTQAEWNALPEHCWMKSEFAAQEAAK